MATPLRAAVPAASFLCAFVVTTNGQQPTFRAHTETVRLDLLVTAAGRPVVGLRAEDFEVYDAGVRQELTYVGADAGPSNVLFVLDTSASVDGETLNHLSRASQRIMGRLRVDDKAALLTFGDQVTLRSPLGSDVSTMKTALTAATGRGQTALLDAAYSALWTTRGDPGRTLAIVFSDGLDTTSVLSEEQVLESAGRANTVFYGVSSSGKSPSFLKKLCDETGGRMFSLKDASALDKDFATIFDEFRSRYVASYQPDETTAMKSGWHELRVRVKRRGVNVIGRRGYMTGPN